MQAGGEGVLETDRFGGTGRNDLANLRKSLKALQPVRRSEPLHRVFVLSQRGMRFLCSAVQA
jgi:hypothetical protein